MYLTTSEPGATPESSMDAASAAADSVAASVEVATRCLATLFEPGDCIAFRSIETWTDDGKKRSQVDYRSSCCVVVGNHAVANALRTLVERSDTSRVNLCFGVCPRVGRKGYDLAWQVRTVRTLWADVDDALPEEAIERCRKADLPEPTLVIGSGNGTHLYWQLAEPYLIDDVGPPPKVEKAFVGDDGHKTVRKYVTIDGERLYLDQRPELKRLSEKAHHVQNVLAGIAEAIGGDHTYDLARLLRVPGTLNRKDQRNGRAPKPTKVHTLVRERRYAFSDFERFAKPTKEAERERKISEMPLPKPRKLTAARRDSLAEQLALCRLTGKGARSETEFGACCFAVRKGIGKDEFWTEASGIGKFAEAGQAYFDRTWEAAERAAREETYDRLTEKKIQRTKPTSPESASSEESRPSIVIAPDTTVDSTYRQISAVLRTAGNCYSRSGQLVVIRKGEIRSVLTATEIAGLLSEHVEILYLEEKKSEYKPLTSAFAGPFLKNAVHRDSLPAISLFTRNPVFAEDWRLVQPGYDAASGIYYAGSGIAPADGTECLDELLRDFCFRTPGDRTNYLAVLLTIVLMPRFIGSKPALILNGNQAGLGKTMLAQTISIVRDDRQAETVSYNPNDEEFEKRLGAAVRTGATTIIVDNAKTRRGAGSISSQCLERSITDRVLSYRLLGKSELITTENSHIFCLTANAPDVSPDLVSRSIVSSLHYEGDPGRRKFRIADPEEFARDHRARILAELLGLVERWRDAGGQLSSVEHRFNKRGWAKTVGGILMHAGQPDFFANADEVAEALDEVRSDAIELFTLMAQSSQGQWTSSELVELADANRLLAHELGEGSSKSRATKMGTLCTRFKDLVFQRPDGSWAQFRRIEGGRITHYRIDLGLEAADLADLRGPSEWQGPQR